jgi:hypothetical protein
MATVIRLLMVIRWILMLPAVMLGCGISRVERTKQLPGRQQWLQSQPLQLRLLRSQTPQRGEPGQGWRVVEEHPWKRTGFGKTEMRVRVVGDEYRFTVESRANDRWEMHQLMAEAPLIAQWAQRTYGGAPIEVIVRR